MGKISVQRALTEIKTIDARIEKKTLSLRVVEIAKEGKLLSGTDKIDFNKRAESDLNSLSDLIGRKSLLKLAINKSNLVTEIKIKTDTITVAGAILLKEVFKQKEILYDKMQNQLGEITRKVNSVNDRVNENALKLAQSALGKDNVDIGETDVDMVIKPFLKINLLEIIDPLSVSELVLEGKDEIIDFFSDIDILLSESNALTFIEV